jgi:hypothetical protein
MAYFTGVGAPPGSRGRFWTLDPDVAIAAPNEDDMTILAAFLPKRRLPEFRAVAPGRCASSSPPCRSRRRWPLRSSPARSYTRLRARHAPRHASARPRARPRRRSNVRSVEGDRLRLGTAIGRIAGGFDRASTRRGGASGVGAAALPARAPAPPRSPPPGDARGATDEPDPAPAVLRGHPRPTDGNILPPLRRALHPAAPLARPWRARARGAGRYVAALRVPRLPLGNEWELATPHCRFRVWLRESQRTCRRVSQRTTSRSAGRDCFFSTKEAVSGHRAPRALAGTPFERRQRPADF